MRRVERHRNPAMISGSASEQIATIVHSVFTHHGFENTSADAMPLDPHLYKLVLSAETASVHVHCIEVCEMVIAHARGNDGKIHRLMIDTSPRCCKKGPCPLVSRIEARLLFTACPAARPGTHIGDPSDLPPPLLEAILKGLDKASLRAFATNRALVGPCRAEHKLRPQTRKMVDSSFFLDPFAYETRMYPPSWARYTRSLNIPFALFDPSLPLVCDGLPEHSALRMWPFPRRPLPASRAYRSHCFELDDDDPRLPSPLEERPWFM